MAMKKALSILNYFILFLIPVMAWAQPEPSEQVSGFSANAISPTAITLSWSDAAGATLPEFYLILGRKLPGGAFAAVDDGPEVPADADWSDNNFAAIVDYSDPNLFNVIGLDPESEYEFVIYSYRENAGNANYKISGVPTVSDFTFSTAPGGHPSAFTATLNGTTTIDLAFDAANTLTDADGYVIYRRAGSAASLTGLSDGAAPPGTLGGTTALVYTTNDTEISYPDIGLGGGVTYHYVLVPFNYNGTDDDTYNYLTDGSELRANATTPPTPPTITGYSADPTCMGETITINGTGFGSSTPTVTVNGINVVPLGNTSITITIIVPATTSGNATVVVTNTENGLNDSDNSLTLKEAVAANLPLSANPGAPVVSQNYSIVVSNSQTTVNYRVLSLIHI